MLAAGFGGAPARAQTLRPPSPSPAAPGDLSRPGFDTTTPLYDLAGRMEKTAGTVVAEVDGRAITLGEVGDAIKALPPNLGSLSFEAVYPSVLEQLIRQQALVIRAQHQALDEDPAVRRKVKAAADQKLANELLRHEIGQNITEAALLARYKTEFAGKPGPEEVHVRVIMVPTEKEAADLIAELRAGADFAALARRSSKDATAAVGGDLGFVHREGLNPEVGAVAFTLPVGQVTAYPLPSAGGWFIVKAEERRRQATPAYTAVRDQLVQAFLREGVAAVTKDALAGVVVREYSIAGKELTETSRGD